MLFNWIRQLRQLWHTVGGLFSRVWDFLINFKRHTLGIFDDIQTLVDGVKNEIDAIQHFTINPKWKTRVISAPRAVDMITTVLPGIIQDFITQVRGLVADLKAKVEPTEFNLEDVEGLERLPTKLVQAAEKLFGWATMILDALETIENAIAELNSLVDDVRQFREAIENLDGLFLPQSNARKTITVHERARIRNG